MYIKHSFAPLNDNVFFFFVYRDNLEKLTSLKKSAPSECIQYAAYT
jgi:hypothetical protein